VHLHGVRVSRSIIYWWDANQRGVGSKLSRTVWSHGMLNITRAKALTTGGVCTGHYGVSREQFPESRSSTMVKVDTSILQLENDHSPSSD
jgi:hypothetical protein